jgi:hypothetical protein
LLKPTPISRRESFSSTHVTNIDRTARSANLLLWHRKLWLIDHGAALYFHHNWADMEERYKHPFPSIKEHILLEYATALEAADVAMLELITEDKIRRIVELVPDDWMSGNSPFNTVVENRQAYVEYLVRRLHQPRYFVEEALRARSVRV